MQSAQEVDQQFSSVFFFKYGDLFYNIKKLKVDHKEDWALKNWCFQTCGPEKTLKSPLDSKGIKAVNPE